MEIPRRTLLDDATNRAVNLLSTDREVKTITIELLINQINQILSYNPESATRNICVTEHEIDFVVSTAQGLIKNQIRV